MKTFFSQWFTVISRSNDVILRLENRELSIQSMWVRIMDISNEYKKFIINIWRLDDYFGTLYRYLMRMSTSVVIQCAILILGWWQKREAKEGRIVLIRLSERDLHSARSHHHGEGDPDYPWSKFILLIICIISIRWPLKCLKCSSTVGIRQSPISFQRLQYPLLQNFHFS